MRLPKSKDLVPIGSALDDLTGMPEAVRGRFGAALRFVQNGGHPSEARPFREGVSREVMKLVEDFDRDTYRAAYVADFPECVYLLHVFKKKSTSGIGTPKPDINTIEARLKAAREDYQRRYGTKEISHERKFHRARNP
jgi:phage-related protein